MNLPPASCIAPLVATRSLRLAARHTVTIPHLFLTIAPSLTTRGVAAVEYAAEPHQPDSQIASLVATRPVVMEAGFRDTGAHQISQIVLSVATPHAWVAGYLALALLQSLCTRCSTTTREVRVAECIVIALPRPSPVARLAAMRLMGTIRKPVTEEAYTAMNRRPILLTATLLPTGHTDTAVEYIAHGHLRRVS
jgi:hypothetical protein